MIKSTNPRILICNDDGYDAKGIKLLEKIAKKLSNDVWVVAPDRERSAASHALTITNPLRIKKIDDKHFTVDGTPTDCVIAAVCDVMKDNKPDLILSGINNGANLSDDVIYSGTVAAAMEGTMLGIPSIALSQCYNKSRKTFWRTSEIFCENIIKKIISASWEKNILISVNFPPCEPEKVTGIEVVNLAKRYMNEDMLSDLLEERIDPRGRRYLWVGGARAKDEPEEISDVKSVINGKIAVTPITIDLTDHNSISDLTKVFETNNA